MCWATRVGKTTIPTIGLAYRIDNDPAPALWVNPNAPLAKSFSATRWQPLIAEHALAVANLQPGQAVPALGRGYSAWTLAA
jgi:phage terminase large subunit GpA-like protein